MKRGEENTKKLMVDYSQEAMKLVPQQDSGRVEINADDTACSQQSF